MKNDPDKQLCLAITRFHKKKLRQFPGISDCHNIIRYSSYPHSWHLSSLQASKYFDGLKGGGHNSPHMAQGLFFLVTPFWLTPLHHQFFGTSSHHSVFPPHLAMPGQEDGEGEVGIAHHQGIGAGIDELQAVEPRDPKAPRIPQGFADSVGDQTKSGKSRAILWTDVEEC